MSLDEPQKNKMMTGAPVKKGFHFASDGLHFAEFIEAETIAEATAIYHQVKRRISDAPAVVAALTPAATPASAPEQSPTPMQEATPEGDVQ
jgi:hypothetical protein